MRRFSPFAVSVLLLFGCVGAFIAQPAVQQNKLEPWQTDWKAYAAELGKDLQRGVDPTESTRFKDKVVEFEGILRKGYDPAKPDDSPEVEMEPQQITVALKLFPGVDSAKAGNQTGTVTVRKLFVKPAAWNIDAWKTLKPDAKVHFRATLANDAVVLVTTSDIGGLVFLFVNAAEVLPPK